VEKRSQATSARVEGLARSRLQMRAANPAITTYVAYPDGVAQAQVETVLASHPQSSGRVQ